MLNRDSSVKSTWTHCSGVQLQCSRAQCNRALTCAGDKGTHTTGRRANSPPSCSLRDTVWRDMGLPAAADSCDSSCRSVSVLWRLAHCNSLWMTLRCTFSSLTTADCLAPVYNIPTALNASHRANGCFY
ncbi:hypothetical protein AVEN_124709-1 [Araneus ventricosus]|uniref:Uncharacterized protein n=1 Tax=Araneus ventricosus TaxID=182803 RepID=A0A4Y2PWZ0_ARAVE|nr:hypothetical protein AVEN_124709-1 [Araneus ventricosus]